MKKNILEQVLDELKKEKEKGDEEICWQVDEIRQQVLYSVKKEPDYYKPVLVEELLNKLEKIEKEVQELKEKMIKLGDNGDQK